MVVKTSVDLLILAHVVSYLLDCVWKKKLVVCKMQKVLRTRQTVVHATFQVRLEGESRMSIISWMAVEEEKLYVKQGWRRFLKVGGGEGANGTRMHPRTEGK